MFVQSRVVAALERNAEQFLAFETGHAGQLGSFRALLETVASWSRLELEAQLGDNPHPGARPTAEQDRSDRPTLSFGMQWQNHEEARAWAMQTLSGRPTFAVDGSQIMPQHTFSIPTALVQVGWFENPHEAGLEYEKDIEVEVLPPRDVAYGEAGDDAEAETEVGVRRFQREAERIIAYLRRRAGDRRRPVAFFDGSLVASWAKRLADRPRQAYVQAIVAMLAASQETGVPLIGYVDTTYARDLTEMVAAANGISAPAVGDAGLLTSYMRWGDRSPAYICARGGAILNEYKDAAGVDWSRQVAFAYLKTTADLPPARLEFPLWIVEAGLLDDVVNIVRGEVVVGNGYPYALETADAVAVLTMEDREHFNRTFQEFARRQGLGLHFSRKALSKRQRRT